MFLARAKRSPGERRLRCPFACFFVYGQPPTAWIRQRGSGWCHGCPRRSCFVGRFVLFAVLVASRRSAAPWPRQRHAPIPERVRPSSSVHGYRKKSGGVLVGVNVDRICGSAR